MKIKHLLVAAGLLLSASSMAQNKIEFEEYDLDNGLHVILHKDKTTPIAAVTMMYHVGSKNEDTARTGFAHFFEHLLFEGSQNIDRGEFDNYVENAGGTLNANTSNDRTFYYVLMPSNQVERGLWLESERLLHAKVENIGVETQREVVKEEKRLRVDNQPYGTFIGEAMKRSFSEHPYRWMPIGSMEHLNAAQEVDYQNFYNKFYVPNNAVLSIAGDIDIKQTKEWINKYFATVPAGDKLIAYRDYFNLTEADFRTKYNKGDANAFDASRASKEPMEFINALKLSTKHSVVPRPNIVEPPLKGEIRDTIYDNIQLPGVFHTYRIPAQGTPDFYAVSMLNMLLSGGNSSRMTKKIVDEDLKALYVGSFPFPLEDPGVNIIMAICNMGNDPKEVEASIDAEVKKVQDELISDKEFQKLRNQIENDYVSGYSTIAGIAESLANYHMYFGEANLINTEMERYMKVTKEDIQRVAKKYLVENNRVVLYYLPKEEK